MILVRLINRLIIFLLFQSIKYTFLKITERKDCRLIELLLFEESESFKTTFYILRNGINYLAAIKDTQRSNAPPKEIIKKSKNKM